MMFVVPRAARVEVPYQRSVVCGGAVKTRSTYDRASAFLRFFLLVTVRNIAFSLKRRNCN